MKLLRLYDMYSKSHVTIDYCEVISMHIVDDNVIISVYERNPTINVKTYKVNNDELKKELMK